MQTLRSISIIFLLSCALTACATGPLTKVNKKMAVCHVVTQAILALHQNDTDTAFKLTHFEKDREKKSIEPFKTQHA